MAAKTSERSGAKERKTSPRPAPRTSKTKATSSARKTAPKLTRYEFAENYENRSARLVGAIGVQEVFAPFQEFFHGFNDLVDAMQSTDEVSPEDLVEWAKTGMQLGDPATGSKDLKAVGDTLAKIIIDNYGQCLKEIFDGKPYEEMKRKFSLSADKRIEENTKISRIVVDQLSDVFSTLGELSQSYKQLNGSLKRFSDFVEDDEIDFGSIALNFGTGAMAVASPLVGIPILISRLLGSQKDTKAKQEFGEQYWLAFEAYLEKTEELRGAIIEGSERVSSYIQEKYLEVNWKPIEYILKGLEASQIDVNYYFASLKADEKDMKKLEKEMGVENG